jgi:hypothetical protein
MGHAERSEEKDRARGGGSVLRGIPTDRPGGGDVPAGHADLEAARNLLVEMGVTARAEAITQQLG